MKVMVRTKWVFISAVSMMIFSSHVSSRTPPSMNVGVPLKEGQVPNVGFQWYETGRTY